MTRRKVISESRPWRCPICDVGESYGTNWPTVRSLAQHIAMMDGALGIKEGGAHREWRRMQGISPAEYQTMKEDIPRMVSQIVHIVNANPGLFRLED